MSADNYYKKTLAEAFRAELIAAWPPNRYAEKHVISHPSPQRGLRR